MTQENQKARHLIAQLDELEPVPCPCGMARRAFRLDEDGLASMHLVDIKSDAETHYHKHMTEIYLVLDGKGEIELDGQRHPIKPMSAILIKPGCRHRAIGNLRIINVAIPAFDPNDEWTD